RSRRLLRQDDCVRAEALADELREGVGLLDRLRAREREQDASLRGPGQPLEFVERVVPRQLLEAALPELAQRIRDPVPCIQVRERGTPLVAEPALVDLWMVPR